MTDQQTPFQPGQIVSAYFRDSGGKNQDKSIDRQKMEYQDWCSRHGLVPGPVFSDERRTGRTTVGRDEFARLIEYCTTGQARTAGVAGVVFWEYSRWARQGDDAQYFISMLRRQGYIVYSMDSPNITGPFARVYEAWQIAEAEEESHRLSRRVTSGMYRAVTVDKAFVHPDPPTGYRKTEPVLIGQRRDGSAHYVRRLEPDPLTAPLMRRAFEMRASGASLTEINNATGRLFANPKAISRSLCNPIYIGVYRYSGQLVENYCEPIVDLPTWRRVQEIQRASQARYGPNHPRSRSSRFLLSGLGRCAACGSPLVGTVNRKYTYYRCNNLPSITGGSCPASVYIRLEQLDTIILARLVEILERPEILVALYDEREQLRSSQVTEHGVRLAHDRDELKEIDQQIRQTSDAISKRPTYDVLLEQLDRLMARRDELRASIAELETTAPTPPPAPADVSAMCHDLAVRLQIADLRQRQLILRALDTRLTAAKTPTGQIYGSVTFNFGIEITREL